MLFGWKKKKNKNARGIVLAEAAASLVVLLPVVVLLLFVVSETTYCYMVKATMAEGARVAARQLAVDYGADPPDEVMTRAYQDANVYSNIRFPNVIVDNQQFTAYFDPTMHTVHVVAEFRGDKYGLSAFPFPDPLRLGKSFTINGDATYRLE